MNGLVVSHRHTQKHQTQPPPSSSFLFFLFANRLVPWDIFHQHTQQKVNGNTSSISFNIKGTQTRYRIDKEMNVVANSTP